MGSADSVDCRLPFLEANRRARRRRLTRRRFVFLDSATRNRSLEPIKVQFSILPHDLVWLLNYHYSIPDETDERWLERKTIRFEKTELSLARVERVDAIRQRSSCINLPSSELEFSFLLLSTGSGRLGYVGYGHLVSTGCIGDNGYQRYTYVHLHWLRFCC